jgi:hypothetical protein
VKLGQTDHKQPEKEPFTLVANAEQSKLPAAAQISNRLKHTEFRSERKKRLRRELKGKCHEEYSCITEQT